MGMSGGSAPSTQTVTNKTELPAHIVEYAKDVQKQADEIAARPFPLYDQPRIAGFTPYQNQGMDLSGQVAGSNWYPSVAGDAGTVAQQLLHAGYDGAPATYQNAEAGSYLNTAGPASIGRYGSANVGGFNERLDPNSIAPWMSPYIQQALQPQLDEISRNSAITGRGINAGATSAGAFGDARHGVQLAENDRNTAKLLSDVTGQGYQTGFDRAVSAAQNAYGQNADTTFKNSNLGLQQYGLNAGQFNTENDAALRAWGQNAGQFNTEEAARRAAIGQNNASGLNAWQANAGQFNTDLARRLSASGQLPSTIAGIYGISEQQAQDLMNTGKTQQDFEQEALSTAYQDHLNQFQYQQEMLNLRLATLAQQPYSTTRLTTTPYSSTAQNIGALAALAGLFGGGKQAGSLFG